jgi:hypothetical protein
MATRSQPDPEIIPDVPTPAERALTVKCPSCGSEYRPATLDLVSDTNLGARIRELEADVATWREQAIANKETADRLGADLAKVTGALIPEPEPPARPKKKSFGGFVSDLVE